MIGYPLVVTVTGLKLLDEMNTMAFKLTAA